MTGNMKKSIGLYYLSPMANRILIDTKNPKSDTVFELLDIDKPKNSKELYEHFLDETICKNMDGLIKVWENSKDNGVMFFIPIDTKNIQRVFLGVNANHNEFNSALKDFCNGRYHCNMNKEFNNILKASIHDDRFKLVFNPHQSTIHER